MEHRTSGFRSVLSNILKTRAKDALAQAAACALESLEQRVLMTAAVVPIMWEGHSVQVYQDEYVALVRPGVNFAAVANRQGFTNVQSIGGNGFWEFDSSKSAVQIQRWSKQSPNVISVSPNAVISVASTTPNDPHFLNGDQWQLNNTGQIINDFFGVPTPGTPGADISATKAWDITTGSSSVDVAILDTGLDITHPDLAGNVWTNPGETTGDGVDNDHNGFIDDIHGYNFVDNSPDITDVFGHGSHVAGIIGAKGNNSLDVSGVNWNVGLIGVKVLDDTGAGSLASIVNGIQYVTTLKNEGVNIVAMNLSLGGTTFPFNQIMNRALQRAGAAGVLAVIAAGNGDANGIGENLDNSFTFPGKFSLSASNVITVAATGNTDQLTSFSNFGAQSVLLAAPGESIMSTVPDVADTDGTADGLLVESGTSQATPQVTGILALEKAANPNATMMQLKQALLNGVDQLSSLMGNLSGARKVLTGGRANAFKALQNVLNPFLGNDTVTQGNWRGPTASPTLYGTEGKFIAGESTSTTLPALTITGASSALLDDSTKDQRTLQTSDGSTHIAGALVSSTSMTLDFNFTDGKAHRVAIYMVDFDRKKRSQTIDEVDPTTGTIISGEQGQQHISGFQNGQYAIYELRGHVQLRITRVKGPNAVVNGVFIDPAVTSPSELVATDATTSGNWRAHYGSQGAFVVGASAAFPDFALNTTTGATTVVRQASTRNPRALENPSDPNHNIMAYLTTPTSMSLDLNLTDGQAHKVSLYVADYENRGRAERIEILNPNTGDVEETTDVSGFSKGKYITFQLTGHNIIRITKIAGTSAVLSGVFFDAPASNQASYDGIDASTHGDWKTNYGADGSYVIGDTNVSGTSFNIPLMAGQANADVVDSVDVTLLGSVPSILNASIRNHNALQKTRNLFSADRILAGLYTHTSEAVDLNFNDAKIHRLSLYAWDNDKEGRIETITITDANGNVLVSQKLANFQAGKYISFDVSGHVQVHVTRNAGDTAVINGLFFD